MADEEHVTWNKKHSTQESLASRTTTTSTDVPEKKKRGKFMNALGKIWRLEEDKVESANDQEQFVRQTFRELIIYLVFLIFVCIIAFTMASTNMYYYTKVMMDLFLETDEGGVKFKDITKMEDFWTFAQGALMKGLYWTEWYNKKTPPPFKGLIYYENKLLGPPRLRQLKVYSKSCKINEEFEGVIDDCYAQYDDGVEDKEMFRAGSNGTKDVTDDAWKYRTHDELTNNPYYTYWGKISSYSYHGYVIDLKMDRPPTEEILKILKEELWLRRGSRAVFISFTVYNANINLFCVITLCVEFPATGGAVPSWSFDTVKLIRYVTDTDYFVFVCEVIFMLFIFYYTVEEMIEICSDGWIYFFDFWNLLDMLLIIVAICCACINVVRVVMVSEKIIEYQADDQKYQYFEYLGHLESQFNNLVAALVFFSWVKVFKYISFNKTMTQLSTTLNRCAKDLLGFLLMFSIVFVAFTQLGYLLFGSQVNDFGTFINSFFTLFRIILGDFDFKQLEQANRILGPIFFMLFVFFVFFVLINMFLAIINDTYSEVKSDMAKQVDVFIMSDYVKQSINRFMDKLVSTKEKMEGIELYLQSDKGKRLGYDEWKNELLRQGYDDDEIEKLFIKYDVDNDRTLDHAEQKKMLEELDRQKGILKTKKKDGLVTSFGERDVDEDSDDDDPTKKGGVPHEEFSKLASRVDKMEEHIAMFFVNIEKVSAGVKEMKLLPNKH